MQSRDEKSFSPNASRSPAIECHDPVRKDFHTTLIPEGIPENEINDILKRAYGFLMHFANYESGGVLPLIFGVDVAQSDVLLASYDADYNVIQYYLFTEEDATSKTLLQMAIDETLLTTPLAAAMDHYDIKLTFLAMVYFQSYHNFKAISETLEAHLPEAKRTYFPTLPDQMSEAMRSELKELIKHKNTTGEEIKTSKWEEIHNKMKTASHDERSSADEVARKFFVQPYTQGSHLYELLTVACYLQETITSAASYYLKESLLPPSKLELCQARWKKYISVQDKLHHDNAGKLMTNIEVADTRQLKQLATLNKIVNFKNLNYYLSAELLKTVVIKKVYFKILFDELEEFFVSQEKKYNAIPKPPASQATDFIYANDFSLEFMRHATVIEDMKSWNNDPNKINLFKTELLLEAQALMVYARLQSSAHAFDLSKLVPASFEHLLRDTKLETLTDVENCLFYFDYEKIKARHECQSPLSTELYFLLSVYTSAGMFILNLIAPREELENLYDETNYINARTTINKHAEDFSEEKSANPQLAISSPQSYLASASRQRLPFQGLNYEHRDFTKNNAAAILTARHFSKIDIYRIIHKLYHFVLSFCDYESQGLMGEIFKIEMPKERVILATFDKQNSKLKWHPATLKDYEDKIIIQLLLDEDALIEPLSKVYDAYDTKMYHLSGLFNHTHNLYHGVQTQLQKLDPLKIYPDISKLRTPILSVINQLAGYMAKFSNGKYPSSKQWDEKHAKISDPICRFVIAPQFSIVTEAADNQAAPGKIYHRFIHQPYYAGSELDEIPIAMYFIQETLFTAASKALPSNATFQEAAVANFERSWRKFNSVKCAIDPAGRLIINVAKDNFMEMRALAIIQKVVDLKNLAYAISPAALENQPNKFDYFKALLGECALFNEARKDLFTGIPNDHQLLSVFLTDYLNKNAFVNLLINAPWCPTQEEPDGLAKDATAFMIYIDYLSSDSMSKLTGFELNFIPVVLPGGDIDSFQKQANNSFAIDKFNLMLRRQITSVEKFTFLAHAYISIGLFLLRLNSQDKGLYDLTDYTAVRSAIKNRQTPVNISTNSPASFYSSTNAFIGSQIQRLLDEKMTQATPTPRKAKPPAVKANVKSIAEAQPSKVKKDKPKKRHEHKPEISEAVTTPSFLPPRPEQPVNLAWVQHKKDFADTKSQYKLLQSKIESLQDEMKNLTGQLQQTLALDNKDREFDLRPHKKRVQALAVEVYLEIYYLDKQINNLFSAMKPDVEDKLEENKTALSEIKIKLPQLAANQAKLLPEIKELSAHLDHIIPKNTLKKAEAVYLEAQRKKERVAREQEAAKQRAKEKVARPLRPPKPSQRPIATLSLQATPPAPAKKTEFKESKPNPRKQERLLHLNEACKNIILIHKMLTNYKTELSAEVMHYALLYNIFRCFQSLKMYQQTGGQQRSINRDEVINLRNMIMHHGASSAHPEEVQAFAEEINATLPQKLLRLTPRSVAGFELEQSVRHELMAQFNLLEESLRFSSLLDHSALVLDNTPFYLKLAAFHEEKTHNDNNTSICEMVIKQYIPLIKDILAPLIKATGPDSEMKQEHFIESFYFELHALRMLVSICGEFEPYFKATPSNKNLLAFLKFSRQSVRNEVAHSVTDDSDKILFFTELKRFVANIDEKSLSGKLKQITRSTATASSSGMFSQAPISAMDASFDKPTEHKPRSK